MNTSRNNFVTVNEILSDVLKKVDDERMDINSKGYYTSLVQQALEGLSFDTFFDIRRESFPFPKDNLTLEMPIGAFNVKEVYLFTGSECDITRSQKVWHKENYFTRGIGYFAGNKANNSNDPFFPSNTLGRNELQRGEGRINQLRRAGNLDSQYFYNIQNGMIMFSSFCRNFPMVHIVYNGTGCDLGDIPIIPLFLREAVIDFVAEATLVIRMAKDPKAWAQLWSIYDKKLNRDEQYGWGTGSWYRAKYRVMSLSSAEKSDLFEYLGSSQWQSGL